MPATSLSVCRSKIGTSVSVRNVVGGPRIVAPTRAALAPEGTTIAEPALLMTKNPSKARVSGWTPLT